MDLRTTISGKGMGGDYMALLKTPVEWDWKIKYFSIKWLQVYGIDQSVEKLVRAIAADLDVTDKVVSLALNSLEKTGFLIKKKIIHGKGRPRHSYQWVRSKLSSWSAAEHHTAHHHLRLIDHLLASSKEASRETPAHKLDRQNRLLLAVLLAHADRCGAVRGLSQAQLAALTDMDKRAIARRIRALGADEYIRSYCPGVRGYHLFGAAPGMYFLNLSHSVYGSNANVGFVTTFEWGVGQIEEVMLEGREVFRLASGIRLDMRKGRQQSAERRLSNARALLLPCTSSFIKLAHLFEPSANSNRPDDLTNGGYAADYLQRKIEEYASYMLSERWQELAERCCVYAPELLRRIERDLRPSKVSIQLARRAGSEPYRNLAVFIYVTAQQLARRVQSWIKIIPNVDAKAMNHCIMPAVSGFSRAPFRSIVSFYKEWPAGPRFTGVVRTCAYFRSPNEPEAPDPCEPRHCEDGFDESDRCIAYTERWDLLVERVGNEGDIPRKHLEASGLAMRSAALHQPVSGGRSSDA